MMRDCPEGSLVGMLTQRMNKIRQGVGWGALSTTLQAARLCLTPSTAQPASENGAGETAERVHWGEAVSGKGRVASPAEKGTF